MVILHLLSIKRLTQLSISFNDSYSNAKELTQLILDSFTVSSSSNSTAQRGNSSQSVHLSWNHSSSLPSHSLNPVNQGSQCYDSNRVNQDSHYGDSNGVNQDSHYCNSNGVNQGSNCHCSNDSHQSQPDFNGGNESNSVNDELNNHHHAVSSWTEAVHHIVLLTLPLSDFSHSVNE